MTAVTKNRLSELGKNALSITISAAAVCGIIMGVLWTYAKPYVITEIDTRMKQNNDWIKATYFEPLKNDLNVEEVKKTNKELVDKINDLKVQMAVLTTELRMSRK